MDAKFKTVTRNALFYSEDDFNYECTIMENYIEEDVGQKVVLYSVDRKRTNINDIYKESDDIRFKAPRELPCLYEIEKSNVRSFDSSSSNGVYAISGKLSIKILSLTLEKRKCDIRRGDYIGVQLDTDRMYYFVVTDDGRVNTANTQHIGAYKPAWREIEAAPATRAEFNGR
ncbi:MAG: hypothetical protein LUD72_14245 [Bacteroidales bacterium]|nr:hypothetical protein [Bacteroidales bacterium]